MHHLHRSQSNAPAQHVGALPTLLLSSALALAGSMLCVDAMANGNVNLAWDPVSDPRVDFYEMHWGTAPGRYQATQRTTSTSIRVEKLAEGRTYFFAAKACNQVSSVCSEFSEELSTTIDYATPIPNFSQSKTSGIRPLTITFSDSSKGKINSYHWNFGDGNSSSAATAVHTYNNLGTYSVNLTVAGPGGTATKTKTDWIRVSASDSEDSSLKGTDDGSNDNGQHGTDPIIADSELPIAASEITLDQEWKRVDFERSFTDPVVVATSVSGFGGDPVTVRIDAIDQTGFWVRLQEWEYLDDLHITEALGYLVVERGSHQLPNGAWLEADEIPVSTGESWQDSSFLAPFTTSPVVLSSVATYNDASTVVTRLQGIDPTGFEVMMQGAEGNRIAHATEMVAYIAWEASCGEINGRQFSVGKTANEVTHTPVHLRLLDQCTEATNPFTAPPVLLTDMQTTDGPDTANLRWDSKARDSVRIWVDEEQSRDDEVEHTTEVVGYLAIGQAEADGDLALLPALPDQ